MDPVLKLYIGCPVMLPYNANVSQGLANGTQACVERILLHPGVVPRPYLLKDEIRINTVRASQVLAIECRHENQRVDDPIFQIPPQTSTFTAKMVDPTGFEGPKAVTLSMKATQVPLISNNATMGHKLQGSSLDSLYVHTWSTATNWSYVVLSRVRTRNGLYLRDKLPFDEELYAVPTGYTAMMAQFEKWKPEIISEAIYESFWNETNT